MDIPHKEKNTKAGHTGELVSGQTHSFSYFRIYKKFYDVMITNHKNAHMIF